MSAPDRRVFRPLALVLALVLVASPLVVARAALADASTPAAAPGPGSGSSSAFTQANKAFGLLFMIIKLAELCRGFDWPDQGGPPPAIWGSHPDPLPVVAPIGPADGCELPYNAPVDR